MASCSTFAQEVNTLTMSQPKTFSYLEPAQALTNRIQSHAKYGTFSLHHWIDENCDTKKAGQKVLGLGCGNGNYTDEAEQLI